MTKTTISIDSEDLEEIITQLRWSLDSQIEYRKANFLPPAELEQNSIARFNYYQETTNPDMIALIRRLENIKSRLTM